jgi:hypothetical protein
MHRPLQKPVRWHIGANPGGSWGSPPYALARPVIDLIVERINRQRAVVGGWTPGYGHPGRWPGLPAGVAARFDVKFGLAACVAQFAMAPSSAWASVMFYALRHVWPPTERRSGSRCSTPSARGLLPDQVPQPQPHARPHRVFLGFLACGTPRGRPGRARRTLPARGARGGLAILFDYSSAVSGGAADRAGAVDAPDRRRRGRHAPAAAAAWVSPLLWLYQWRSFGHPFYRPALDAAGGWIGWGIGA